MIDFSCKKDIFLEDEDGLIVPMSEPYFRSKRIAPGTWQVLSDGDYSYLLEGDDEALLIDSGYGAGDIRAYCQTLTEKPLSKICPRRQSRWRRFRFRALRALTFRAITRCRSSATAT